VARATERRTPLTPHDAATLIAQGASVTVERSAQRIFDDAAYERAGCSMVEGGTWAAAPVDTLILGVKELPDQPDALAGAYAHFAHLYKGQRGWQGQLARFMRGGGTLFDLEYLTDETGARVAAFGYWAGFAGAAVSLKCWVAQQQGGICPPVTPYATADAMTADLLEELSACTPPSALIIGALGRVGTGAADLLKAMNVNVTSWDMAETAHGGPFPEILDHPLFINCILAGPQTPPFVLPDAPTAKRALSVIGDIACDPDSAFNPVQVYDATTTWAAPATRVHDTPPLDVMAIDNLPSMLPLESSEDYAGQLLPTLLDLPKDTNGVWARASDTFMQNIS
jgi:saccharopine dehydrogenase (NAD+, L-lysine-forming)